MDATSLRRLFRYAIALSLPWAGLAAGCGGGGRPFGGPCPTLTEAVFPDGGVPGGSLSLSYCQTNCTTPGLNVSSCESGRTDGGVPALLCTGTTLCATGRRPAGLLDSEPCSGEGLGAYFAEVARLEAASVPAFETLASELSLHGAPPELIAQALAALQDEVRHARMTSALARRYGGALSPPIVAPSVPRSLEDLASENAVEGCVRETFGALVATWQAQRAADPAVRRAMARIARDETRHAALGFQVASWAGAQLDQSARARVADARAAAVRNLEAECQREPAQALIEQAGLPHAAHASAMVRALSASLWC